LKSTPSRSFIFAAVLIASVVLVAPSRASAQNLPEARTWSVTPFLHTSIGIGDPAPGNSIGLGVAVSYDWTSRLAFEGELGHLFDVADDTTDVDWSVSNFSANALYRFDTKYVTPYVTLGLGVEHTSFDAEATDPASTALDLSGTEFAVNFGGGFTRLLNDRWAARADLRHFQSNDASPDYWRLYGGLTWRIK
jgi:opacity protein-like surface antigen